MGKVRGMNFKILPLWSNDLVPLSQFYHSVWHETHAPLQDRRVAASRNVEFFGARLRRWQNNTRVAWHNSLVAGFVSWDGAALDALFVGPEFRSAGLGATLLATAEAEMLKRGQTELCLDCVLENEAGRRFYEGHGWRVLKVADCADEKLPEIITRHWVLVKP